METIAIQPLSHPPNAVVNVPGSKSYTQRALILAALARGKSLLRRPLAAEDTARLTAALQALGAVITPQGDDLAVSGVNGRPQAPGREIYLGNNGTAMRILTGVTAIGQGEFVLTGDERLRERPLAPLLAALNSLGVSTRSLEREGYPPVSIHASGLPGGRVALRDLDSSQYVSALLIAAPYATGDMRIELAGRIPSRPYIAVTVEAMEEFGVEVRMETPDRYFVRGGQGYRGTVCRIEGDVSSASYFFLAAALAGGSVTVENVPLQTKQGDIGFLKLLDELGCRIVPRENGVTLQGGPLQAGTRRLDLRDMPDMVPTLAVLAAARPGRTAIVNVAQLRVKESDRLAALATELRKMGATVEEKPDGLVIAGGAPRGAEIETYNDHRIAMSFAVLGLVVPGVTIRNPRCVEKSFPGFWRELNKLAR
ncbi:MAG: 3-phosphoshikimate 1-carboxyvinyltransferase [Pseudomonadota bacterium]|nr:3-phosphoshikimate 1-carboxyvinyltransferase [Pseudomonadota bacterium]